MKAAIQHLSDEGYTAYVVGGSVRDFLLERPCKDIDLATSASPDELCRLFPNAVTVGKAFGVLKIPVELIENARETSSFLEIATFREDLEYKDHRHPTSVRFAGPEEDAHRRDFTVNALFYDWKSSRILDFTAGFEDLKAKLVRAIGDPDERFREDALRLLRAVRFTVSLDFALDPATADAMRERAKLILKVSSERVRDELNLMWSGPNPARALEMLHHFGFLKLLLPEVDALQESNPVEWRALLKVLDRLRKQNQLRPPTLVWGALLHDLGKPTAENVRIAGEVVERFKLSRSEIDRVVALVEDHLKFKDVFKMREATLLRLLHEPHFEELLALHKAVATATDGNLAQYEFCATRFAQIQQAPDASGSKLIDGTDLIQLGLEPGPGFSEILRTIEDLAMEKRLTNKEEALEYVVRYFVK